MSEKTKVGNIEMIVSGEVLFSELVFAHTIPLQRGNLGLITCLKFQDPSKELWEFIGFPMNLRASFRVLL